MYLFNDRFDDLLEKRSKRKHIRKITSIAFLIVIIGISLLVYAFHLPNPMPEPLGLTITHEYVQWENRQVLKILCGFFGILSCIVAIFYFIFNKNSY